MSEHDVSVETKYWFGDSVGSILADDLDGIVIGIQINLGPSVSYNVAWINRGERKTDWFKECELRGVAQMEETIGFVSKKEEAAE